MPSFQARAVPVFCLEKKESYNLLILNKLPALNGVVIGEDGGEHLPRQNKKTGHLPRK